MEIEKYDWVRIRTNNGEWISEIHTEMLDDDEVQTLEALAWEEGKSLDKHYGYYDNGEQYVWCYKNEIDKLTNGTWCYRSNIEEFE